jgi:hypothetical protein
MGILESERIVGIIIVLPVLASAVFGVSLGHSGLVSHPFVQALQPDNDNKRKRQNDHIEPGPESSTQQISESQTGDDHCFSP